MLTCHGTQLRLEVRLPEFAYQPLGFAAGDTNLHRYVGNHPTNATDPSGLAPTKTISESVPVPAGIYTTVPIPAAYKATVEGELTELHEKELKAGLLKIYQVSANARQELDSSLLNPNDPGFPKEFAAYASRKAVKNAIDWFGIGAKDELPRDNRLLNLTSKVRAVLRKIADGMTSGKLVIRFVALGKGQWGESVTDKISLQTEGETAFWKLSPNHRIGVLIHEMSHAFANTNDHGYLKKWGDPDGGYYLWEDRFTLKERKKDVKLSINQLLDNADTFEGYFESLL